MNQSVSAAEINKHAEAGDVAHATTPDLARLELLDERVPTLRTQFPIRLPLRQDEPIALSVSFNHLQSQHRADETLKLLLNDSLFLFSLPYTGDARELGDWHECP